MRWPDFGLLLLVAATHLGYTPLAALSGGGLAHEQTWFYILRGVEGAIGFAVAGWAGRQWPWWRLACAWGFVEELQTAACGLAAFDGAGNAAGQSVCQALTGLPPYTAPVVLVLMLRLLRR